MRRSRFTESQIASAQQVAAGDCRTQAVRSSYISNAHSCCAGLMREIALDAAEYG